MKRTTVMAVALALGLAMAAGAAGAASPALAGTWLAASGNVEVQVAPCGAKLCGTIVRVLSNQSMAAGAKPGAAMKGVPGLGVRVLDGLEGKSGGVWAGTIYNRENGKTYACRITLPAADRMELRAYVGLPLFGQTQVWKRVG